jgi:hypothetical protein
VTVTKEAKEGNEKGINKQHIPGRHVLSTSLQLDMKRKLFLHICFALRSLSQSKHVKMEHFVAWPIEDKFSVEPLSYWIRNRNRYHREFKIFSHFYVHELQGDTTTENY